MHFRIRYFILFCTGLLVCMACAESGKNEQLQKALKVIDANPQEALEMLQRIPYPQSLSKDEFMCYVVLLTQAKYMDNQDIGGDKLILDAQSYFTQKNNPEMATRANYYAACFLDETGAEEKALEYSMLAHYFARQAGDSLFMGKSAHWIGSAYYDRDMLDSAKVYYQQALDLYDKRSNVETYKLGLISMLGRTYLEMNQPDQALTYFNNGLKTAERLGEKEYELRFLNNLGMVFIEKKDYRQAKEYLSLALSKEQDTEDDLRVFLNFARLYKATSQSDSTLYCLNLVKNRIAEITFPYTRKLVYQELVFYYKNEGNIHEMEHYLKLEGKENLIIKELQNEEEVHLANARFEQYKQRAEERYSRTLKIVLTVVIMLVFLLIIFGVDKRRQKDKNEKEPRSPKVNQKMDVQNFLLGGLRNIAKSMDHLCRTNEVLSSSSVREQFQMLRSGFNTQIADLVREVLNQLPNGANALPKLSADDLCIIHLSQLKYPDESIMWMLGFEYQSKDYIVNRKERIRSVLTDAGVNDQDLKALFP